MKLKKYLISILALSLSGSIFALPISILENNSGGMGVFEVTIKSNSAQPQCDLGNGRKGVLIDDFIVYKGKDCSERSSIVFGKTCILPNHHTYVTSDRLLTLLGVAQNCAKFDIIHSGKTYSTGNIRLTWDEKNSRYQSGIPSSVVVQLP